MTPIRVALFVIAVIHLVAKALQIDTWSMATKPLLLPCLIYMVYEWGKKTPSRSYQLLLRALFLGWMGDILLMFDVELFFQLGLGCFLLGHVFYLRLFGAKWPWQYAGFTPWVLVFVLMIIGYTCYGLMYPSLDTVLKVAVGAYIIVLSSMVFTASARWIADGAKGFAWVTLGGVCFLVSDGLISIDKFVAPLGSWTEFWIMATYIPAQWLITEGIMSHEG